MLKLRGEGHVQAEGSESRLKLRGEGHVQGEG